MFTVLAITFSLVPLMRLLLSPVTRLMLSLVPLMRLLLSPVMRLLFWVSLRGIVEAIVGAHNGSSPRDIAGSSLRGIVVLKVGHWKHGRDVLLQLHRHLVDIRTQRQDSLRLIGQGLCIDADNALVGNVPLVELCQSILESRHLWKDRLGFDGTIRRSLEILLHLLARHSIQAGHPVQHVPLAS